MEIVRLNVNDVLPLRQAVLWPHKSIDFCRVSDDEWGDHFGVKVDGDVICVASVFVDEHGARLRKFATAESFQGRGIGSQVLVFLTEYYRARGVETFWFDARETALSFYRKFGFAVRGDRFFKSGVAYFKMVRELGRNHNVNEAVQKQVNSIEPR